MQYSTLQSTNPSSYVSNQSGSALIKTGNGTLQAILINSNASGQIKIWDSLTASGTVMFNTTVLSNFGTTGERYIPYFGSKFLTGLYVQVVAGNVDFSVIYN